MFAEVLIHLIPLLGASYLVWFVFAASRNGKTIQCASCGVCNTKRRTEENDKGADRVELRIGGERREV